MLIHGRQNICFDLHVHGLIIFYQSRMRLAGCALLISSVILQDETNINNESVP